jgi:hypothetical protein
VSSDGILPSPLVSVVVVLVSVVVATVEVAGLSESKVVDVAEVVAAEPSCVEVLTAPVEVAAGISTVLGEVVAVEVATLSTKFASFTDIVLVASVCSEEVALGTISSDTTRVVVETRLSRIVDVLTTSSASSPVVVAVSA